jgi:hypothetical protein
VSTLHQAVARAIRDAVPLGAPGTSLRANLPSDYDRAAAAAIRVYDAEAQRAVDELPDAFRQTSDDVVWRAEVLAVLAALAEDTP